MSDSQGSPSTPAGWYADPAGSTSLRWWDGVNWTEHLQTPAQPTHPPVEASQPAPQNVQPIYPYVEQPYGSQAAPGWNAAPVPPIRAAGPGTVPPGTPVYNVFIWVVTLLPLLSLLLLPLSLNELDRVLTVSMTDPYAMSPYAGYSAGGLLVQALVTILGWLIYGAGVLFAYLDRRWLLRLGYPQPFHWAWAFLGVVYPIGRSVVVRRRAGRGIAPLWVTIALMALGLIVSIVVIVAVVNVMLSAAVMYTGSYT